MKRFFFPLMALFASGSAALLMQGCTIRFVQGPQATPVPYPNAWHIEQRVRSQINRISTGLQTGRLSQDSANALAENDALVRRFARDFQGPPTQTVDLTAGETATLDNMLTDNDRFIDDAYQRNQTWVSYFQGGNYDYTSSDRTIFIASLDYQLNRQQADVKNGLSSGSLTNVQARELQNRIQVIQDLKRNDYRSNGRIDLSEEQVRQLSQMTEDNDRYLRFRLKGNHGRRATDNFTTWKKRTPLGLGRGGNGNWGRTPKYSPAQPAASTNSSTSAIPGSSTGSMPAGSGQSTIPSLSRPASTSPANSTTSVRQNTSTTSQSASTIPATASTSKPPASASIPSTGSAQTVPARPVPSALTPAAQSAAHSFAPPGQDVKPAPTVVTTAKVPATLPNSSSMPAQANLKFLPPGMVVSFLKHVGQMVRAAVEAGKLDDSQAGTLNGKLAALQGKANDDFKKNGANSVTKEQMDELSGMGNDISKFIQVNGASDKEKEPSEHGQGKESSGNDKDKESSGHDKEKESPGHGKEKGP